MDIKNVKYTPCNGEFTYKNLLWNKYTTPGILEKVERFNFLTSDIVVNTFPRSGTTLTQEIVWHIKNKNIIKKGEKYGDIDERFPFLEFNSKFDDPNLMFAVDRLDDMVLDAYRLIKTHCPLSFIRENLKKSKPKCIVVFRNPRDVCLSLYHFYKGMKLFGPWSGTWDEFLGMFIRGNTECGGWFQWQSEWWNEMQIQDISKCPTLITSKEGFPTLFYTFEKMIKDPVTIIKSIANFMEESITEEQLEIILYNTNFKQMIQDSDLNFKDKVTGFSFIRKGQIGGWKEEFSNEEVENFQNTIEFNLSKMGMNFDYEN